MKTCFLVVNIVIMFAFSLFSCKDPEVLWGEQGESAQTVVVYSVDNSIYKYHSKTKDLQLFKTFQPGEIVKGLKISNDRSAVIAGTQLGSKNYFYYISLLGGEQVYEVSNYEIVNFKSNIGFIGNTSKAYLTTNAYVHLFTLNSHEYAFPVSSLTSGNISKVSASYYRPSTQSVLLYFWVNNSLMYGEVNYGGEVNKGYLDSYYDREYIFHTNQGYGNAVYYFYSIEGGNSIGYTLYDLNLETPIFGSAYDLSSYFSLGTYFLSNNLGRFCINKSKKEYYYCQLGEFNNQLRVLSYKDTEYIDVESSEYDVIATYSNVTESLIDMK